MFGLPDLDDDQTNQRGLIVSIIQFKSLRTRSVSLLFKNNIL